MRPIDMHNHMIAPEVIAHLEREGERYQTRIVESDGERSFLIKEAARRPINARISQPEARVVDMDAEGVGIQAISCVPFIMYPDVEPDLGLAIAQINNDALISAASRVPDRFVPLASAPMQDPEAAARELERVAKLGVRGVEIPPKVGEQGLDEPQFEPFWAAAESLDLVVCIHPFDAAPAGMLGRYNLGNAVGNLYDTGLAGALLICGGVLERHPSLRVVLYHAGGAFPAVIGRIDNAQRVNPAGFSAISRPPSSYVNQLSFDTIAFNPDMLRYLTGKYGSDHLVIGTDYPLDNGRAHPVREVKELGLAPNDEEAVLGLTGERLLRLGGKTHA
jgi:aminocarboxymuconate-semialdehyde decarboxylase